MFKPARLIQKIILTLVIVSTSIGYFTSVKAQNSTYNISDCGAKSGIKSLQAKSIQAAIDVAAKKGGGQIIGMQIVERASFGNVRIR